MTAKRNNAFLEFKNTAATDNRFAVEASIITDKPGKKRQGASKAYLELKKLAARYPDNEFLQTSLKLFSPDHETGPDMQDDILLNEGLSDKYGI